MVVVVMEWGSDIVVVVVVVMVKLVVVVVVVVVEWGGNREGEDKICVTVFTSRVTANIVFLVSGDLLSCLIQRRRSDSPIG